MKNDRKYLSIQYVTEKIFELSSKDQEIYLEFEKKDKSLRTIRAKVHYNQPDVMSTEDSYLIMEDLDLEELRLVNISKVTNFLDTSFSLMD